MIIIRYPREIPYTSYPPGSPARPLLPVRLQHGGAFVGAIGIVDSGADTSLFNSQFAPALGLNLATAATTTTQGIGGQILVVNFDIVIMAERTCYTGRVGFSPMWTSVFGLLGRADFFAAFQVGFDQRRQRILLNPAL